MGKPWMNDEENEYFDELLNRDDLNWDQIRIAMVDRGFENRGARAYQSRAYRLDKDAPGADNPEHYSLYKYLRDEPKSLRSICDKFELPPKRIRALLQDMKQEAYNIVETDGGAIIPTKAFPKVLTPDISIADLLGSERYDIGLISDLHCGGDKSQPTEFNRFIRYANERHGVTEFFYHGDWSCGIYGYRGHEVDQIPAARPLSRPLAHLAVERQVQLAESYFPHLDGVTYHMLGGNHDWWHVVNVGVDGLRRLCNRRSDMHYLGYDMAPIALTDKTYMRMWHPTGGTAYAKSYRVQKAIESESLESLKEAMRKEDSPHVSIITAGHLHQSVWVPSHPIYGALVPCYEGQTNYLKRKKLSPDIGGVIMRFNFDDGGRIAHIGFDYVPGREIKEDWKNWPVPEIGELIFEADDLETVFSASLEQEDN